MMFALVASAAAVTVVASPLPDATHEVVCQCDCGGETQTYEWFPNFACSRYDGIQCDYGEGSQSTLADCVKKAQPKDATAQVVPEGFSASATATKVATPTVVTIGSVAISPSLPYQPYPLDVIDFDIPTGAEYVAWLDGISNNLFGTTFPGLVLDATPTTAGASYGGFTAVGSSRFSLDVTKIDEQEVVLGYVDPNTFFVADLTIVWLRGTLSSGSAAEYVEGVAITAVEVGQPSNVLTTFIPDNPMYPFTTAKAAVAGFDGDPLDELLASFSKIEVQPIGDEGDPCQACKDDANKKIKRMKRDLKSCLKWTAAGAVLSGLVSGGLGGIVVGGLGSGYCADQALDTYSDIITDFCACFKANDCGPHEKCPDN